MSNQYTIVQEPGFPPRVEEVESKRIRFISIEDSEAGVQECANWIAELPTKVIFRKWPKSEGGDVIALFVQEPADSRSWWNCSSYEHVGQHCAADPSITDRTTPANSEEYADLMKELESYPHFYKLVVGKRRTRKDDDMREAAWREMRRNVEAHVARMAVHLQTVDSPSKP